MRPKHQPQPAPPPRRPTPAELRAARGRRVPDIVAPNLKILFVGINPGLYSGAVGHHFARPGNRFWPALQRAGLTPRLFAPQEERALLDSGIGITNIVNRTTATARELSQKELTAGGRRLTAKIKRLRPCVVAFLGIDAYRSAFGARRVRIGSQALAIGTARIWVLPNPSGLNAHYQPKDFARLFRRLRSALHAKAMPDRRGSANTQKANIAVGRISAVPRPGSARPA
jgi:TDG/mug DNA glycosylase family protein